MAERILEKDSIQMYELDQSKYAIVNNRRRMIAEIRDGLIPVQRRILYGAFKQHLISPKINDKSATLVGYIMGQLHAHGDCKSGDTLVYLLDGTMTTMKELYESGNIVEILAIDPISLKVVPAIAHSFRIGQYTNKKYHIIFSNGYHDKCTSNHPYMLPNGTYIKAEYLKPYMRLMCKNLYMNSSRETSIFGTKSIRPIIDNELVQNIVSDYYYGPLPTDYVRHHIDYNTQNNTRSNIMILPASDHALIHQNDISYSEIYFKGLEKGRQSMFSDDSPIRYKIIAKNTLLRKLYNEEQGLRRFKWVISFMKSNNIEVTEENYENLRSDKIIYNIPLIEKLSERYPQYNCHNFDEWVNLQIPTIGEKYDQFMANVECPISFIEDSTNNENTISYKSNFSRLPIATKRIIDNIIDLGLPYTVQSYRQCITEKTILSDDEITKYLEIYKYLYPFVIDVAIEDVDNEPMYDFTVEGYENMLIPIGSTINTPIENIYGNVIPMISIHNSSIYGAIGTMASWYKTKYPLTYGEGNWGNLQGAGPAAMRYTHCSLSDFGYEVMIEELAKSNNVIDWVETFKRDGSLEPEYLPAKLPILLLNGAFGIGTGLQINIPSFNLLEVAEVLHALIKNPNAKFCLIPDLCQPCTLIGDADTWQEINEVGRGAFKIRGHIVTEQDKKGDYILHIVSLPDNVNTTMVYEKIMKLVEDKQLPMIKDIYNSLNDECPDIIIHLRSGSDPEYVKQALYAKTNVQQSFSVNFEAVSANGIDIKRFDFRSYLLAFIDHRMTTKFRLYCNLLQQVMTRHHQVDAFVKVLESGEIDNIIAMIKKSKGDDNDIVEYIIKKCKLTDIQAKFIINVNLSRLSLAHLNNYRAERKDLEAKIKEYEAKVTDDGSLIKQEIDEEIQYLAKKYGSPRICDVVSDSMDNNIPAGIFKVVITEKNYIRKLVDSDKINIVRKDNPKFICRIDNRESILVFDAKGKCYNIAVNSIPVTDKQAPGTDSRLLVKNLTADIISMIPLSSIEKILANKHAKYYFVVLTKSNCIKKLDLEDFVNVNKTGLIYTKLKDDMDEVVSVKLVPAPLDVCISSGKKALRFSMKDIPILKRIAGGVKAIDTTEEITGMVELYDQCTDIIVVTRNGKLNRFNAVMLSPHKRGSKGSGVCKLDATDSVFTIIGCREQDRIKIVTTEEVIEINVADIKLKSPIAPAQKVIPFKGVIIRAEAVY